ncbi:MAG: hypothetical protein ABI960_06225 [Candidatus Eisenbacteria bacterium]
MSVRPGAILLGVVSLVVGVAVVVGFLAIGTPREQRSRELDRKRVESLRQLAQEIVLADRNDLARPDFPESLESIRFAGLHAERFADPVTGERFAYRRLAPDRFELCARFDLASRESDLEAWEAGWSHPAGRVCFEFARRGVNSPGGLFNPVRVQPSASPASRPIPPSGAR